jgi:hypothetical protein
MEHQTFADGIGRIAIIDGIVRLDLIAHSATETDSAGKPKPVFAHRVVMGIDQFLRASQKIAETTHAIAQQTRQQVARPIEPPAEPAPQPAPQAAAYQAPQHRPQAVPPQFRRESVHPQAVAAEARRPFP